MADSGFPTSLTEAPGTLDTVQPTADDVVYEGLGLANDLKADFVERDRLFSKIDDVVFLRNHPYIPRNYRRTATEVRTQLPVHTTGSIVSALSVNPPKVKFRQIGYGDAAAEEKALREEFFRASWDRQQEEAVRNLFRPFVYSVVVKGEGILKTVPRRARAWAAYARYQEDLTNELEELGIGDEKALEKLYDTKTEEYKRAAPYPIATVDVPPETFYYVRGEDGLTVALEDKQVPWYETLRKYHLALDAKGRVVDNDRERGYRLSECVAMPVKEWPAAMGRRRTLRMVEVWTWDSVAYILQGPGDDDGSKRATPPSGYLLRKFRHGYGDPGLRVLRGPYFHSYGITTASREHGRAGLSVLFGYLELFTLLDQLLTIQSQAAITFGFPAWKRIQPPALAMPEAAFGTDAAEARALREIVEPGKIFPYDIAPIEPPRGGIDLDKAIATVKGLIDMLVPPAVQGDVSGDMAGYALNQAAHLARLAWDPMVDNMQFALAQRVGFESWLIEHRIGERVYVYGDVGNVTGGRRTQRYKDGWLAIGPDDLRGIHRYAVELEPEKPQSRILDVRTHREMLELGLESQQMAIEAMGNNPVEVERQRLLEAMKQDPQVQALIRKRVWNRLVGEDQQTLAAALQGGQAAAGPPQANEQQQMMAPPAMGVTPMTGVPGAPPQVTDQRGGAPPVVPPISANVGGVPGTPVVPQTHVPLPGEGG